MRARGPIVNVNARSVSPAPQSVCLPCTRELLTRSSWLYPPRMRKSRLCPRRDLLATGLVRVWWRGRRARCHRDQALDDGCGVANFECLIESVPCGSPERSNGTVDSIVWTNDGHTWSYPRITVVSEVVVSLRFLGSLGRIAAKMAVGIANQSMSRGRNGPSVMLSQ